MDKVTVRENGPYVISTGGQYTVEKNGQKEVIEKPVIALCRCGASQNKPFCDGSHKTINFEADGAEIELQ